MEACCLLAQVFSLPHFHRRSIGLTFAERGGGQINSTSRPAANRSDSWAVCLLALSSNSATF